MAPQESWRMEKQQSLSIRQPIPSGDPAPWPLGHWAIGPLALWTRTPCYIENRWKQYHSDLVQENQLLGGSRRWRQRFPEFSLCISRCIPKFRISCVKRVPRVARHDLVVPRLPCNSDAVKTLEEQLWALKVSLTLACMVRMETKLLDILVSWCREKGHWNCTVLTCTRVCAAGGPRARLSHDMR